MNRKALKRMRLRIDKTTLRQMTELAAARGGLIGISATLCAGETCYLDCVASVPFTNCGPRCT